MPDTPEKAARRFVLEAGQGVTGPVSFDLSFVANVAGAKVGFYGPDEFEWAFKNLWPLRQIHRSNIEAARVEDQTENEATVFLTLQPQRMEKGIVVADGEAEEVSLALRREDKPLTPDFAMLKNRWRVVPPKIEDVLAKPLFETPPLQLAAALATRDPRLLPLIRNARGMNQLKQLGLGVAQFTQDYDEFYAFDDAAHERALLPYLKDKSLYTIAGTKDEKWRFNDNLSGVSLANIEKFPQTVLFYDGSAPQSDKLNFRWDNRTLVCFADGHVEQLKRDELEKLIWKP